MGREDLVGRDQRRDPNQDFDHNIISKKRYSSMCYSNEGNFMKRLHNQSLPPPARDFLILEEMIIEHSSDLLSTIII